MMNDNELFWHDDNWYLRDCEDGSAVMRRKSDGKTVRLLYKETQPIYHVSHGLVGTNMSSYFFTNSMANNFCLVGK